MISIILIALNNLNELKITLPALQTAVNALKQSSEVEIILSDDGSIDGSPEWVQQNYPEIHYFWHKNLGRGPNRNFGADHAQDEYLIFMDADIEVEPAALSGLLAPLREHADGICFGNLRLATGDHLSPLVRYLAQKFEKLMRRFAENLDPWDSFSGLFSITRNLFARMNGFSADFKQYGGEDTEFFLRCSQAGARFVFAKAGLGWHHQALDLKSNLRRVYLGSYSNALIARKRLPVSDDIGAAMHFGRVWYERLLAFLTLHRLWSWLVFLHPLLEFLPAQNKAAFYFYHFLFEELAQKGRDAGLKALNP